MPRKRNEKYSNYEQRKLYFYLTKLTLNYAETGHLFSDKYAEAHGKAALAFMSDPVDLPDGQILGLNATERILDGDQSPLLEELQTSINEISEGVKEYDGPFKDFIIAQNYVYNPANGDIFEILMDNPSLERILTTFAAGPMITSPVEENGVVKKVINKETNQRREKAMGEFAPLYMDYYKSLAGYVKVLYDRQKAEAEGKIGLESVYAGKYAAAIDKLVDKFDKLKAAAEKRYKRNDLTQQQKDLKYFPGTEELILNNDLAEVTSADPQTKSRNNVWVAIENLRAQSKAIKNGWSVKEAAIMGLIAEAKFDAEENIVNKKRNLEDKKNTIDTLKSKEVKPEEKEQHNQKIEKLQAEYEELEKKYKIYEDAARESDAIYKKYTDMKNPDYLYRRDALKEVNEYIEKYKEPCKLSFTKNLSEAVNDNTKDPFDFKGKTRAQQAKSILKSLEDVDQFMRSSTNFKKLKDSVQKLVELAEKYPEMNKQQFKMYHEQARQVRIRAQRYLRGKREEDEKYRKKNKNRPLKRSEYTSKRINAVKLIEDKLYSHMALTSGAFTKEYTGTPDERAKERYERIVSIREESLMKKLGKNVMYETQGGESINAGKEYTSFLKIAYIEKMRDRYEFDPDFTAKDFLDSIKTDNIIAGSEELRKELKNYPEFLEHMKIVLRERINVAADNMDEVYDTSQYVIKDPIPDGVGREWVRFEMKNFRAMYNIPEPYSKDSEKDNESEMEDSASEIEEKIEEKTEEKIEEKTEEKTEEKQEEKKEEKPPVEKKEEKKEEKATINLAGLVYNALKSDDLLKYSKDPLYREIADDFRKHSLNEKAGENTKVSSSTMLKMAKYIDKAYDKLKNKKELTEDDSTRRTIVESAFRKYSQKPELFEKNAGEFEPNPPVYNPVFGYNHGEGLYKPIFSKMLENSVRKAGEKLMDNPDDKKLAENVLNKAYQVIMADLVENSFEKEKGVPYDVINQAYGSTSDKKQLEMFKDEYIAPGPFKNTFEKMILDAAKEGKLTSDFVSDACDKAFVRTIEECKKNKDVKNEKKTKSMAENLFRKIKVPGVNAKKQKEDVSLLKRMSKYTK